MNNWIWLLASAGGGLLLGALMANNFGIGGRRSWGVSGPDATGALHNQDMWYWMRYHQKQREQQAASLQQPIAMPTQQAMQQQPINVEQVMAQQSLRAQQMQQPGLAAQQQGLAMQAQQKYHDENVPAYMF